MKKTIIAAVMLFIASSLCQAQEIPSPALTADSLATGNYKDVLNSFFQLAFEKLTGPDKELKFTSTPFAVMARMDTNLLTDKNYVKYNTLRNINFAFSLRLDSSYKFNGFTSSVKYAIINKRDETVSRAFLSIVSRNESVKELQQLGTLIFQYASSIPDTAQKRRVIQQATAFRKGEIGFDGLDPLTQSAILAATQNSPLTQNLYKTISEDKSFNLKNAAADIYQRLKKEYNNNLLWTIGITDTTYKNQFMFSNIVLHSELLRGVSNNQRKNDVELNIRTSLQLTDDTLKAGRDLKRTVFSFEPGVNMVLKMKETGKSFFEWKLGGGYYRTFNGLYNGEAKELITLNSTLRIRLLHDIWLPLEIRYDPKEGNWFGFLNVKANFTALGGLAKWLKL